MATMRATHPGIRRQGYLEKLPDLDKHKKTASLKGWKKRWFVFKEGHSPELSYYKDEKTFNKTFHKDKECKSKGVIELLDCDSIERKPEIELLKHKYENVICITEKKETGRRVYYLRADSKADMEDWYKVIQDVLVSLGVMKAVEGDGLVRCNTFPSDTARPASTKGRIISAPGGLIDQFPVSRRSTSSTVSTISNESGDSSVSEGLNSSMTSEVFHTSTSSQSFTAMQQTIVSEEDDERVRCCRLRHVVGFNNEGVNMADQTEVQYVNVHFIRDQGQWESEIQQRKDEMAKDEEDYDSYHSIKLMQDENLVPESEQERKKKSPPPPPPRNVSLPSDANTSFVKSVQSKLKIPLSTPTTTRIRKMSVPNMLFHPPPQPELPSSLPPSPKTQKPDRRQRKMSVPTLPSQYHPCNYNDLPPPDYDIPPVPMAINPQIVRNQSASPHVPDKLANRPLPSRPQPTGVESPQNVYISSPTSPQQQTFPPHTPRNGHPEPPKSKRKLSRQEMLTRPLPSIPDEHAQPDRPLPATLSLNYETPRYANCEAILVSQTSYNVSPRTKRKSITGSLPNLLDIDDDPTFGTLHPEVQSWIPQSPLNHPVPPPQSSLPRNTPSKFSFDEVTKPKIPQSRRTIKKHRKEKFEQLKQEMSRSEGIIRRIAKEDLVNRSLAFVEIVKKVWVAGWKSTVPKLSEMFHLGDQILSINGHTILSVKDAYEKIELSPAPMVDIQFRRVPLGEPFFMERRIPDESWGIVVKGMSGGIAVHSEIDQVLIGGLAFNYGLKNQVKSIFGRLSKWAITEIDFKTVSLFANTSKVKKDIDTGELDIILLVQPCDFIKEVKKQLQETKNWYDYNHNNSYSH